MFNKKSIAFAIVLMFFGAFSPFSNAQSLRDRIKERVQSVKESVLSEFSLGQTDVNPNQSKEISDNTAFAQEINAPFGDPVFKSYCLSNFDTNKDGQISKDEAANVQKIEVPRMGIHSLKGIEFFTNIIRLNCQGNQLTHLDVSKNTELLWLYCWDNKLTDLDVSKNTALTILSCWDNQLTHLDVSNNPNLSSLNCENNQLTNLDVSKNTNLSEIKCDGYLLTNLNVGKNTDVVSSRTASDDAGEKREIITFSTPMDVFNFLQSRVFKSSDGITLDISPYGVKADGRAITGAVQVTYIQRQQAIMKATSPATGHTYTFIAYADKNCIVCDDDHTMYFGKK